VAGLSFCPGCGFDTAEIGQRDSAAAGDRSTPAVDPMDSRAAAVPVTGSPSDRPRRHVDEPAETAWSIVLRQFDRGSRRRTIVIGAAIVVIALIAFSQLTRPRSGGVLPTVPGPGGQQQPGSSSVGPALIVGLTIQSPTDGQQIATRDVTVIGIAPPGLSITRDVSLGLDQHATADGTGHWAMNVGLNEGENKLKFRIGDDRSTEQTLRVIYTPQAP
jgi:hypothetical protein